MELLMASPGHRANIMDGSFREVGIGVSDAPEKAYYWVQDFGYGGSFTPVPPAPSPAPTPAPDGGGSTGRATNPRMGVPRLP
jgi:hypothetical protein